MAHLSLQIFGTGSVPRNSNSYDDFLLKLTSVEEGGLARVLESSDEAVVFKNFLDEEHSSEHLLFWLEAEVFKVTGFIFSPEWYIVPSFCSCFPNHSQLQLV